VKFESKSVRFDEETALPPAIHRPASARKGAPAKGSQNQSEASRSQGAPMSSTQSLLELEKEIKIHQSEGNFNERNKNLVRYCRMANEAAQMLDQRDQKKALALLEQCIKVIRDNASKQTPFDELLYETQNNIARCYNIQGDIEMSLQYLLKAYTHVQNLAGEREIGSVTILPELSLNICNAYIYEMNYHEAIKFANEAVKSSSQCIIQLTRKLDQPISDDPVIKTEQERLSELYKSQVKLHIQGY
jgi:tetratricopeptide (TPR) repeat protein